jgi:hypothetical protein
METPTRHRNTVPSGHHRRRCGLRQVREANVPEDTELQRIKAQSPRSGRSARRPTPAIITAGKLAAFRAATRCTVKRGLVVIHSMVTAPPRSLTRHYRSFACSRAHHVVRRTEQTQMPLWNTSAAIVHISEPTVRTANEGSLTKRSFPCQVGPKTTATTPGK